MKGILRQSAHEAALFVYTFAGEHVLQVLTEFETLLASKGFAIHGLNGPVSPLERADLFDEFLEKYRVPDFSGADMVRMK